MALLACGVRGVAAADSPTVARSATLAQLFPADEVPALSKTLSATREVRFRTRMADSDPPRGLLVYVSPDDSGELPDDWVTVLDQRRIAWIAADGFGNARPTAERMLAAMMAVRLARQSMPLDPKRIYVAGKSGGGRVASHCISEFPQLFAGAMFIVGADYSMPADPQLRQLLAQRPLVFLTGNLDFNQLEMERVRDRYQRAGLTRLLFMDEPGFGHQQAPATQLERALEFLDEAR
jgi:predicted esterase